MKSSLIPDKPILLYPSLAATVGLEEAILLSALNEISLQHTHTESNGFNWLEIHCSKIAENLPFWSIPDIQRVNQSLRDKGIILIGAQLFGKAETYRFAFNEKSQNGITAPSPRQTQQNPVTQTNAITENQAQAGDPHAHPRPVAAEQDQPLFGKNFISPLWQPDEDTLSRLHQHSIPSDFALRQVPDFVTYWRDRNESHRSWGAKFSRHVLHQWRIFETQQHKRSQETNMSGQWRPSADALQVLTEQVRVSAEFIEDAIPEFILYWQERGDKLSTWNSKFIQHVKLQWHKYNSSLESNTHPRPISVNWQPSEEVNDVLRLANIDLNFALQLIPEFVMYWHDSGQTHTSWNTRFLQYVKRQWAKDKNILDTSNNTSNNKSTREMTLEEELGDRSWAIQ